MIPFPDRITGLIQRIEAGEPVTQKDVDRIATLQALDLASIGEQFVRSYGERQEKRADEIEKLMESAND